LVAALKRDDNDDDGIVMCPLSAGTAPLVPLHLAAEAQPLTGLSNAAFAEMARYEDVLRRSQARLNASSPCSPIAGVGGVRLSGEPELDLWDEDVDEEEDDEDEEEEEDVETKREAEASALKGRRRRGAAKPRATSSGGARSGGGRSRRPVGKGKAEAEAEAEDTGLQSPRATRTVLVPTPTKRRPDLLRHLVPDPEAYDVFVCGTETWMKGLTRDLESAGFPPHRIHSESFTV
jgi:hypothetical protein